MIDIDKGLLRNVGRYLIFIGIFSNLSKCYIDILKKSLYKYNTDFPH
jgi:hypothetical protein